MSKAFPIWVVPVWFALMGARKVRAGALKVAGVFRRKPKPEAPLLPPPED